MVIGFFIDRGGVRGGFSTFDRTIMFGWLFNVHWTLWIVLGTYPEEKDPVAGLGAVQK